MAMPTVQQFVEQVVAHEPRVALRTLESSLVGPKGEIEIQFLYLSDEAFTEPLPSDINEVLTPDTMRRLCVQLGLDSKDFGLHLG